MAVDTTSPDFGDPGVTFVTVPGTREHEAALVVRRKRGTTLVLNDLVGNIHAASGIDGWLLRLAGFAGDDAQIPRVVKMALVKDAADLRAQLLEWAELRDCDASSCRTAIQSKRAAAYPSRSGGVACLNEAALGARVAQRSTRRQLRAGVRGHAPGPRDGNGHQRGRRQERRLEIAE